MKNIVVTPGAISKLNSMFKFSKITVTNLQIAANSDAAIELTNDVPDGYLPVAGFFATPDDSTYYQVSASLPYYRQKDSKFLVRVSNKQSAAITLNGYFRVVYALRGLFE